jgi:hypothetical protein
MASGRRAVHNQAVRREDRGDGARAAAVAYAIGRQVQRDGRALVAPFVTMVRQHRFRRMSLGLVAAGAVLILSLLYRTPAGHEFVQQRVIVFAAYPWWAELWRLVPSMFAPTDMLPFWTSMLQVAIVFGGAQVLLGWRKTVLIAVVGHAIGTMSAKWFIWMGQPIGLAVSYLHIPDAGPSAATIAIGAFIAVSRRIPTLLVAVLAFTVGELAVRPGLAQREHVVGFAVGLLVGLGAVAFERWRQSRPAAGSRFLATG